jgi:hypothetical protein
MRFILHLRGEEKRGELLGAFLEERRAHEVKSGGGSHSLGLACMERLSWRLGHHLGARRILVE